MPFKQWMRQCDEFYKQNGRRPSWDELAGEMELDKGELLKFVRRQVGLNQGSSRLYAEMVDKSSVVQDMVEFEGLKII